MKANELMIGDWVFYGEKPVRVLQLTDGKDYKHINPIPLTPEILDKNGFSINGLDIALFDRKGGDDFVGASNLQYVHELQHALRLCGINKEIQL